MAVIDNLTARVSRASDGKGSQRLLTSPNCPTQITEAYNALLTNLDLALGPNAAGAVAVAAVDGTADAALVATNLAVLTARSGDRTLVVDCDLQRPSLPQLLGLNPSPGIAQLLNGEHTELQSLAQPTPLPLLGAITVGTVGTAHSQLARLGDIPSAVLRLRNVADRVFFITAPVLASVDLLRLAPYVDGILLVVTPRRTERQAAAKAREILTKVEAPVLGSVLAPQ
ncbi:MAG TPA: CpsD/CapB family tyrosine-protein kinase [Chloroflexota bacterium]|nr:CpsD/CapB family tyrosine-protein kinase [Chloroflexota bacterium]